MLTLLLGRTKSGKSLELLQRIRRNGAERKQILLVPEQSSFEMERRLCEVNGNQSALYAEVFSFTSLGQRVFSVHGGRAQPFLDEGGRLLVMYAALQTVKDHLAMFARMARKPEFLSGLIQAVDELKSCCVTPQALDEIADMTQGNHNKKLKDLALIYAAYHMMTTQGTADPRDRLTQLAEKLKTADFAVGTDVYLDGFVDFTPQEELVIKELLRRANSLTVALCCEQVEEGSPEFEVFAPSIRTAQKLERIGKGLFLPVRRETLQRSPDGSKALNHVEAQLFSRARTEVLPAEGAITVFSADNRREELLWVAGTIRALAREQGIRYRDIAVAARTIAPYQDLMDSVFLQAKLPVFHAVMEDILHKPVFAMVTAALDVVDSNFSYEAVFRYLKSGLTNVTQDECDLLENYVLLWNIRGSQWRSKKGFTLHPRGFHQELEEGDRCLLEKLNKIRCKVISPYTVFLKGKCLVSEQVKSLYSFLEQVRLPEQLADKRRQLLALGEAELAQEYDQLWDILCLGLEQCLSILGEHYMEPEEFSTLLRLLFSQYHVGAIPLSLDRVIVGDLPRLVNRGMKVLFLLGADDTALPQIAQEQGILSLYDRELLSDYGISISFGAQEQMNREMSVIYRACTQPTQALFVSWAKSVQGGGERQPSFLIKRLLALFADVEEQGDVGKTLSDNPRSLRLLALERAALARKMSGLPEHAAFLQQMELADSWKRGALPQQITAKLYGNKIAMSASRLDRYKSCHFAYYMQYGLKAKARKSVSFDAPEYGTFVHYVLEHVLKQAKDLGGMRLLSNEALRGLTQTVMEQYEIQMLGGLEEQTPRFRYLFFRLRRLVYLVVENVAEELRRSEFQPIFFELGFGDDHALPPVELTCKGTTLRISGFVDRVDGWVKDGKLYLRVIDYKTGRKSFDLTEVWNGLGLQLLLYLFALEDKRDFFGGQEIIPAGVLYLPARDVVIDGIRGMDETARQGKIDKELIRKGLLLDDPDVIAAMEETGADGPRFLPIRVQAKTGQIKGSSLVSAEKLGRLKQHIEVVLQDICAELESGEIGADPFWRGPQKNACLYCDYRAACHFDEGLGRECRRWTPSIGNEEFWAYLEAQEEAGETDGL